MHKANQTSSLPQDWNVVPFVANINISYHVTAEPVVAVGNEGRVKMSAQMIPTKVHTQRSLRGFVKELILHAVCVCVCVLCDLISHMITSCLPMFRAAAACNRLVFSGCRSPVERSCLGWISGSLQCTSVRSSVSLSRVVSCSC